MGGAFRGLPTDVGIITVLYGRSPEGTPPTDMRIITVIYGGGPPTDMGIITVIYGGAPKGPPYRYYYCNIWGAPEGGPPLLIYIFSYCFITVRVYPPLTLTGQ